MAEVELAPASEEMEASGGVEPEAPGRKVVAVTPLPRRQIFCACLIQMAEAINITMLFPFVPFFMEHLGYEGKHTSLAAGLTASMFCTGQIVSSIPWGIFSDRFGRRPAMLIALLGSAASLLVFGSGTTLAQVAFGRFLGGLLNGNVGVLKVWIAEICDETNRAQGLATLPTAWGLGVVIGPTIGGLLAQPHKQYPDVRIFRAWIVRAFPFLLPCAVASLITFGIACVSFAFVVESLPKPAPLLPCAAGPRRSVAYKRVPANPDGDVDPLPAEDEPPPAASGAGAARQTCCDGRVLSNPRVRAACLLYAVVALLYIVLDESTPFLLREKRPLGGGGMTQANIGILVGIGGAALFVGPWTVPYLENRLGQIQCVKLSFVLLIPIFVAFPVTLALASGWEDAGLHGRFLVNAMVVLLLSAKNVVGSLVFTMSFLLINDSVDNDSTRLGLVNGVAQLLAALSRSLGPLLAGLLWAVGLDVTIAPCALTFVILALSAVLGERFFSPRLEAGFGMAGTAARGAKESTARANEAEEASLLAETEGEDNVPLNRDEVGQAV